MTFDHFVTNVSFEWIIASVLHLKPVKQRIFTVVFGCLTSCPVLITAAPSECHLHQVTAVCHDDVMMKAMVMVFFFLLPVLVDETGYFLVFKIQTKPINVHNDQLGLMSLILSVLNLQRNGPKNPSNHLCPSVIVFIPNINMFVTLWLNTLLPPKVFVSQLDYKVIRLVWSLVLLYIFLTVMKSSEKTKTSSQTKYRITPEAASCETNVRKSDCLDEVWWSMWVSAGKAHKASL